MLMKQKSCYIVDEKVPTGTRQTIVEITRFVRKKFPIKYLGCSLFSAQKEDQLLWAKIEKKLAGWKNMLRLHTGKLALIKHLLTSIPLHIPLEFWMSQWRYLPLNLKQEDLSNLNQEEEEDICI